MSEQRLLLIAPGSHVSYRLKLSARRRTVGMRVDEHGLTVNAPSRIGKQSLERMLQQRADWIISKLGEWQARQTPRIEWRDGERLLFLGNEIELCLMRDTRSRRPPAACPTAAGSAGNSGAQGYAMVPSRSLERLHPPRRTADSQVDRDAANGLFIQRKNQMGQLQQQRRNPPQLAPDPGATSYHPLRRSARTVAPEGNEP